ncbi:XVIPCD domain-containing protein [Lysobacter sp. ESA13C]|uniref:XVIPCD domain-containing protein n=1 Tax=Lysobacter sp. ESA13C TaxID=2862676 RepID=UPI001CBEC8E3|nr:XVIPCD domain-containing protein [Lysobacter sp. ESA13C]
MSITTQQYANLADDAYRSPDLEDPESRRAKIGGVEYAILAHVNKDSGYQGTIYQRLDTKEIVVAHRGTEFGDQPIKDGLLADGGMVANRVNRQASDALEFTRYAVDIANVQGGRSGIAPQVTVTGHSLGGCLAQITAAKLNLNGETFNPYGAVGLGYRIHEGGNQIVNHVMAGDFVSAGSRHFGKVKMYADPVEVNILRAVGYEDSGSRFDVRNPLKAAAYGNGSHRMHHFLDVDSNGRRDHSVLGDARALELAEQHRPMFDRYRGDVLALRGGASVGVALSGGVQGFVGEISRRLPDKVSNPFEESKGTLPPLPDERHRASDPRDPRHPDNGMYLKIRDGVGAILQQQGRSFDEGGERIALDLLVAAKQAGLDRVDHVVPSVGANPGETCFVVQGDLRDPAHKRAQVSLAIAEKTPVIESLQKLDIENQGLAENQSRNQEQARNLGPRMA